MLCRTSNGRKYAEVKPSEVFKRNKPDPARCSMEKSILALPPHGAVKHFVHSAPHSWESAGRSCRDDMWTMSNVQCEYTHSGERLQAAFSCAKDLFTMTELAGIVLIIRGDSPCAVVADWCQEAWR